ncbi:MAG TPA: hypothetical protein VFV50_12870 [Bdellovibrionales bacterium]|nr:hypothetical protein [Bdellovibrionales bacterium]
MKLLSMILVVAFTLPARAQPADENKSRLGGPRRQIALIIFAGLGGAILGLSTLSFYGRPQDRLSNIAIGFAVGIIGGTVYVTYKAAAEPKTFYESGNLDSLLQQNRRAYTPPADMMFNYKLSF